ncbi:Transcriptional activator spt7 [Dispira parvispora]|uniref:Transcriptional activator spt7 n=1 Tax=Dispira parvispora TaxID=1520584 RepID=A0A9W8AP33_9FUNG|nr:Transcriptional activator spt7 [Dispira parvispora]
MVVPPPVLGNPRDNGQDPSHGHTHTCTTQESASVFLSDAPASSIDTDWSQWLQTTAQRSKAQGIFRAYLGPHEYDIFDQVLDSDSGLVDFTSCDSTTTCSGDHKIASENATALTDSASTSLDMATALAPASEVCPRTVTWFRARSMVFEQIIPKIFSTSCPCTTIDMITTDDKENHSPASNSLPQGEDVNSTTISQQNLVMPGSVEPAAPMLLPVAPASRPITSDDDYDDNYDDDGDDAHGNNNNNNNHDLTLSREESAPSPPVPLDITSPSVPKAEQPSYPETFRIPTNAVFHTLEDDLEVANELLRYEEWQRQHSSAKDDPDPTQTTTDPQGGSNSRPTSPTGQVSDVMIAGLCRTQPHLRHLFHTLDRKRQMLGFSEKEFRHLLSDLRTHRSKWASDEKVGQEELYEALEKVLVDLKHYGEHSQPFLTKVNRREAPDYYDVIKEPMDLATMTKKLRALQYPSKKAFMYDINLIVDNCLFYNSDPANIYRRHAFAFRRKAESLLKLVPNITIRDRAAGESEDHFLEYDGMQGNMSDGERSMDTLQTNGLVPEVSTPGSSVMSRTGTRDMTHDQSNVTTPQRLRSNTIQSNGSVPSLAQPFPGADLDVIPEPTSEVEPDDSSSGTLAVPVDTRDVQTVLWELKTDLYRARKVNEAENLCTTRPIPGGELGRHLAPTGEVRRPDTMSLFQEATHLQYDTVRWQNGQLVEAQEEPSAELVQGGRHNFVRQETLTLNPHLNTAYPSTSLDQHPSNGYSMGISVRTTTKADQSSSAYPDSTEPSSDFPRILRSIQTVLRPVPLLPEYEYQAGLPDLRHPQCGSVIPAGFTPAEYTPLPDQPLWRYRSALIPTRAKLPHRIYSNLHTLRQIRDIDDKIWSARLNLPMGIKPNDADPDDEDALLEAAEDGPHQTRDPALAMLTQPRGFEVATTDANPGSVASSSDDLPPLQLNRSTAYSLLSRVVTLLVTHVGFEDLHVMAVAVITDLAVNCLMNIGKTVKLYCDKYARKMEPHEIIAHALFENGLEQLGDLERYLRDDIERLGPKLQDLQRKLEHAYIRVLDQPAEEDDDDEYTSGSGYTSSSDDEVVPDGKDATAEKRQLTENKTEGKEMDLETNADQVYLAGDFGDSLGGDDFFGFKNLGLDEEYGMDNLRLPSHLLLGQSGQQVGSGNAPKKRKRKHSKLAYRRPKVQWAPVSHENMSNQIGLLRPLYEKKLGAAATAVEDDDLPVRQRYNGFKPKQPLLVKRPLASLKQGLADGGSSNVSKKSKSASKAALAPPTKP